MACKCKQAEIEVDRRLQPCLDEIKFPISRVTKAYDMALAKGRSVNDILEHALHNPSPLHYDHLAEDEYCVILNVQDHHDRLTKFRIDYHNSTSTLVVLMPPKLPHETAGGSMTQLIIEQAITMGVSDELQVYGCPETDLGEGDVKQPDQSWGPRGHPEPAVVLEVGVSEGPNDLLRDAARWLSHEDDPTVLSIHFSAQHQRVVLTCWRRHEDGVAKEQELVAWKGPGTTYHYEGDCVNIPFHKLIGRPPNHEGEGDFKIDRESLKSVLDRVIEITAAMNK
ncbi:hypothetical protein KEM56_005631 [Ascosphaera pollenicola]|nr:hypothetical protein KEM56_005631 [Ascosphaera pollenicola]